MVISGIAYCATQDTLLITTSTEDTPNAIDDGTIGNSYLCLIENYYLKSKVEKSIIKVDTQVNLFMADEKFMGFKIESVCIEWEQKHLLRLHLVADNYTGTTYLFKIQVKYQRYET